MRQDKMVEVLYDLSGRITVLEARVSALVTLIEFIVDNLPEADAILNEEPDD
ncbi:MAG: hypothetical protein GTO54_00030 [Nitrososphaeria archaeon]|nr:hypothetical protein [Nitrososphaeria archaeon]